MEHNKVTVEHIYMIEVPGVSRFPTQLKAYKGVIFRKMRSSDRGRGVTGRQRCLLVYNRTDEEKWTRPTWYYSRQRTYSVMRLFI